LTTPSSVPDQLGAHVRGLGNPGEVEHQADVVLLVETKVRRQCQWHKYI